MESEFSPRGLKAKELFKEGYNCAQAVTLAFSDILEGGCSICPQTAASLAEPFGGGFGRLREVCGAVSGVCIVLGCIIGNNNPKNIDGKAETYKHTQAVLLRFKEINGSIICRELLGLTEVKEDPVPEPRTAAYYEKRPCADKVASAATILEEYLEEKGLLKMC